MAEGLSLRLSQTGPIPLDVDITLPVGQTLALVGPSGAGKTTILRAIAGLYRPRSGHIVVNGQTWLDATTNLAPQHRRVGFVFQSYGLFPHLTAAGNIREAMLERPASERAGRADDLLAQVQLAGLGGRYPAQLSGGQQQRVALARALARDPAILLLDEPFSAVDHPVRRALHAIIAEIRGASPLPIVFVSHDVEDAVRSADQLCFLSKGRSLESGPPRTLLDDPNTQLSRWMNGNASAESD
ncbi:hypothetical protein GCM10011529_16820 [Polymorphobacter glacialis]|uniref:ABC transporter domain-containing protein n=1 Tax=Sandarakinorhabdus glacialis TaxID=1614636 RepID=A0A916ZRU7_9SPHN|nr:ATP-binding cassette domain-containing protein [Polymorphobacter glacialis]GGE11086.1 hypothetical protein GCM10011529_16820 [Polymorphobacter glacialis]